MKYLSIIAVIISIGLLSSCTKSLTEEQTLRLNSLDLRLDSTLISLNEIDTAKINAVAIHYFENLDYIQHKMTDTIDRETTFFIDKYYSLKKGYHLFQKDYPKVLKEIAITKTQLENLKHDGDNGLIEDEQFEKYYHLESNNIILISESANGVINAIDLIQPKYENMITKIDSIVISSKQKAGFIE
jgi:hypothetical protein